MINTDELRRNNIVQDTEGNLIVVISIQETGINESITGPLPEGYKINAGRSHDDIYPVPLTTAWLGKCGFLNIGTDQLGGWYNYRKAMPELHSVTIWHGRGGFQFTHEGSVKFIHHLHQLQNLFYFLTGEELTIKETV